MSDPDDQYVRYAIVAGDPIAAAALAKELGLGPMQYTFIPDPDEDTAHLMHL